MPEEELSLCLKHLPGTETLLVHGPPLGEEGGRVAQKGWLTPGAASLFSTQQTGWGQLWGDLHGSVRAKSSLSLFLEYCLSVFSVYDLYNDWLCMDAQTFFILNESCYFFRINSFSQTDKTQIKCTSKKKRKKKKKLSANQHILKMICD